MVSRKWEEIRPDTPPERKLEASQELVREVLNYVRTLESAVESALSILGLPHECGDEHKSDCLVAMQFEVQAAREELLSTGLMPSHFDNWQEDAKKRWLELALRATCKHENVDVDMDRDWTHHCEDCGAQWSHGPGRKDAKSGSD
jgi:hypothetical protein